MPLPVMALPVMTLRENSVSCIQTGKLSVLNVPSQDDLFKRGCFSAVNSIITEIL